MQGSLLSSFRSLDIALPATNAALELPAFVVREAFAISLLSNSAVCTSATYAEISIMLAYPG